GESRSTLWQWRKFGDSHGYRSNATGISWGVSLTTDEFGFRYDPQQEPKPRGGPSIVILGGLCAERHRRRSFPDLVHFACRPAAEAGHQHVRNPLFDQRL